MNAMSTGSASIAANGRLLEVRRIVVAEETDRVDDVADGETWLFQSLKLAS